MKFQWKSLLMLVGGAVTVRGFSISANAVGDDIIVSALGSSVHEMTATERANSFEIDDEALAEFLNPATGKKIYKVVSTDPDVFQEIFPDEDPTLTLVTAKESSFAIGAASPTVLSETIVRNPSSVDVSYQKTITTQESQTVSHEWSSSHDIAVSQEISVSMNLGPFASGSSTTTLSYGHQWGSTDSFSQTVTIGNTDAIGFTLHPGQAVVLKLVTFKGTAEIDVTFEAEIEGNVAFRKCLNNLNVACVGSQPWEYMPFSQEFEDSIHDKKVEITERLTFDYFTKTEIQIYDADATALRGATKSETQLRRSNGNPNAYTANGIPIFDFAGVLNNA